MSNKESFYYQTEFLSKNYNTVAIDITGFGASKLLPFPYSLDDYVNDIKTTISKLGITNYHIVCHSFGCRIALRLATTDSRVNKLIKRFLSKEKRLLYGSKEYQLLRGAMRESYRLIVNEYQDNEVLLITNQTLIIFGENDTDTPLYMAKKFAKKIKNSTLYIVKNAGHFCFIEKPREINLLIKEFLN